MSQSEANAVEKGPKARTRRAILDSAISVLSEDPSASLVQIAAHAEVGRTTIHRYFPERSDLIRAVSDFAFEEMTEATKRAELERGSALDALDRLCLECLELGDTLTIVFNQPEIFSNPEWETESEADRDYKRAVERGQAEGSIDPEMDPGWIINTMWALIYVTVGRIKAGDISRHENMSLCRRSLRKAVSA